MTDRTMVAQIPGKACKPDAMVLHFAHIVRNIRMTAENYRKPVFRSIA